jgi:hypothetical protein
MRQKTSGWLALLFGEEPQKPAGAGPQLPISPETPDIFLQVWVTRISGAEVDRNSGVIPWPLSPRTTVDDLLPAVRHKAALLREWERTPFWGQPPPPEKAGQTQTGEEALRAFPAEIVPVDLRPDRITVTGANNEFGMQLNYEAVYGGGPLKDLYIASRLSRETIRFKWSIYKVPEEQALAQDDQPLPAAWPQRSKWLYEYYNDTQRPEPHSLGEPVHQENSEDAKERVKFPPQPGDYLVICETLHAPLGDYKLKRASSVAYFPVRTKHARDLAGEVVHEARAWPS